MQNIGKNYKINNFQMKKKIRKNKSMHNKQKF